ncbi:MAG TPA: HD domain-containing protein [Oligoflexia bacterium]|nr:HD domain-containing protein [Oligoflexia bacterium]
MKARTLSRKNAAAAAAAIKKSSGLSETPSHDWNLNPSNLEDAIETIRTLEREIARTIAITQKQVEQLEGLANFSAILNSTLDTDTIRFKSMEAVCNLLNCETGSLLLVDPSTKELYWETALGEGGERLKHSMRLAIDDTSIAGHVAATCKTLVVNDVKLNPYHLKKADSTAGFETKNMVCSPVVSKGELIGVLQAINRIDGNFTNEDAAFLEALSFQVAIAVENANLDSRLKNTFIQTAAAMAEAIEAKDRYTGGHTKRVVQYSLAIGQYVKLSPIEREHLKLAAILHDIGKIGIDDKILKKQYALNDEEYDVMKKHPAIGYEILSQVSGLKEIVDGARYHHERPDGKGYPYGLKGSEIPKVASIISVADTYDAMVSTRPYRKGLDPKVAFEEIVKYRGTQFDAEVVDAFRTAFESGTLKKKIQE